MSRLKCALIGDRLGHSYSKVIHDSLGLYDYKLKSLDKNELEPFILRREFDGLNVTIPYKTDVIKYCSTLSAAAERIGSVNTIVKNSDGSLTGHNTDYYGFLHMAECAGISFSGKHVAILGSGGTYLTARAVAEDCGAIDIKKISRSSGIGYDELEKASDCEVLINTTPVGMYPNTGRAALNLDSLKNCEAVIDVIYNPLRSQLLLEAREKGLKYSGGLYMLVSQAAQAAQLFCGESIGDEAVERVYSSLVREVQNIVLIGMPSSGKSTVGALIAERCGKNFVDTDKIVEERAGMSISEIFERFGEAEFRRMEREAIADCGKEKGLVIATGGGAILDRRNYYSLAGNGRIYFLERDIEALETEGRPLSKNLGVLKEMYKKRLPFYKSAADAAVSNNSSPLETALHILDEFKASL